LGVRRLRGNGQKSQVHVQTRHRWRSGAFTGRLTSRKSRRGRNSPRRPEAYVRRADGVVVISPEGKALADSFAVLGSVKGLTIAELVQKVGSVDPVPAVEYTNGRSYSWSQPGYTISVLFGFDGRALGVLDGSEQVGGPPTPGLEARLAAVPPDPSPARDPTDGSRSLEDLFHDLDELVGLAPVKKQLHRLVNHLRVQTARRDRELEAIDVTGHLVFVGNPPERVRRRSLGCLGRCIPHSECCGTAN
jgi:hypothetical protein